SWPYARCGAPPTMRTVPGRTETVSWPSNIRRSAAAACRDPSGPAGPSSSSRETPALATKLAVVPAAPPFHEAATGAVRPPRPDGAVVQLEGDAGAGDEAGDGPGVAAVPRSGEARDGALEAGLLGVGEERGPEDEGQGGDGDAGHHAVALAWPAISEEIRSTTATGSGAAAMDRPMTRKSAPARAASVGVAVRTWSAASSPAGRIPGVTTRNADPCLRLMVSTSTADAT